MGHLDRLGDRMGRLASRRLLLSSGAVCAVLIGVLFASSGPGSVGAVAARCGQPAPDVRFTSSPEQVQDFLGACGVAGRAAYRDLQLVDLVYPAAVGLFLASALALLLPRAVRASRRSPQALAAVPLGAAAFDYLENLAAWTLLLRYPEPMSWVGRVLGTASAAKQVLTWASVLLLTVALVGAALARRRSSAVDLPAGAGPRGVATSG